MRLYRPHIPWSVREQVIDRQMAAAGFLCCMVAQYASSAERRVRWKLKEFCAGRAVELHHRPALCNRTRSTIYTTGPLAYIPAANDPDYLVYLLAGAGEEHDIETRVRGQHGQLSDHGVARKRKRKERKAKRPKRRWPSRKLRSIKQWPKRKLRAARAGFAGL